MNNDKLRLNASPLRLKGTCRRCGGQCVSERQIYCSSCDAFCKEVLEGDC